MAYESLMADMMARETKKQSQQKTKDLPVRTQDGTQFSKSTVPHGERPPPENRSQRVWEQRRPRHKDSYRGGSQSFDDDDDDVRNDDYRHEDSDYGDRGGGRRRRGIPPPPLFDGLSSDNVRMFVKQFEMFAGSRDFELSEYYMHCMKYLGPKVRTMMNRWQEDALMDWHKVRGFLIQIFETKDAKLQSIKEFDKKTHSSSESYREHMHNLQSLKMTGWPEEYSYCKSTDIRDPFNNSLVEQFLKTCRSRDIANKVETLIAEKRAMETKLSIENIIEYCEALSNARFSYNPAHHHQQAKHAVEACGICGNGRHRTRDCPQFKKMNAIILDEETAMNEGFLQERPDQMINSANDEINAFDNSKPGFVPQKSPFNRKPPFRPNGQFQKTPDKSFVSEARCFKCGLKGHLQPDCKVAEQTTLGKFAFFKFSCEQQMRDLQQKMELDSTSMQEKETIVEQMTKRLTQIKSIETTIKCIEDDDTLNE